MTGLYYRGPARGSCEHTLEVSGSQLVEAGRVEAVFLGRPARHRVEPDVRDVEVEEDPAVGAVGHPFDVRGEVFVLRGQVLVEQVEGRTDSKGQFVLDVARPEDDDADLAFEQAQSAEEAGDK